MYSRAIHAVEADPFLKTRAAAMIPQTGSKFIARFPVGALTDLNRSSNHGQQRSATRHDGYITALQSSPAITSSRLWRLRITVAVEPSTKTSAGSGRVL